MLLLWAESNTPRRFLNTQFTYVRTEVNYTEEVDDPVDSDGEENHQLHPGLLRLSAGRQLWCLDFTGEVLGFENLVFSIFDFVHTLLENNKFKSTVKKALPELIYYIILYMQITEEQVRTWSLPRELKLACVCVSACMCECAIHYQTWPVSQMFPQIKVWTANPQQFVEDEDDDTFSYSVRISAQDLLMVRYQPPLSVMPRSLSENWAVKNKKRKVVSCQSPCKNKRNCSCIQYKWITVVAINNCHSCLFTGSQLL